MNGEERGSAAPPLSRFLAYFLRLGTFGFGGPIALAAAMERDLVEERGWISAEDYKQGLTLSQLAPGPLAAQLAMYLGYVRGGALGSALVGAAFILPSFLMTVALGAAYVHYGGLRWMQAAFYGVGAAVVGIIARSAWKLTRSAVGGRRLLWAIYAVMAAVTAATRQELVSLILLSGVLALFAYAPPRRLGLRSDALVLFLFFAKAGAFVFGSGLAIVPFLYGGVVREHRWLTERQFLDAVAVAMITPGPVVITVAFIGYLVSGLAGACLAAAGVFLPPYLFVVIPADWFRRHGSDPRVKAFVDGVTAAAVGALVGAAFVLARGAVRDVPTAAIAAASLLLLTRAKVPEPALVAAAAAAGLALYPG